MTKLLTILLILNSLLYSYSSDEKIFQKIINSFDPKKTDYVTLSEEQYDLLCGASRGSMYCEARTLYVSNEVKKRQTQFMLESISTKYNIDKKILNDLYNKYSNYINLKNGYVNAVISDYYLSTVSSRQNSDDLDSFFRNLDSILNNEFDKSNYDNKYFNFKFNDINNIAIDNNYMISILKNYNYEILDIDWKQFTNEYIKTEELWKDYEISLNKFLKKLNKHNDIKWLKSFYTSRNEFLQISNERLDGLEGAENGSFKDIGLSKLKNYDKDNFFENIDNKNIIHKFIKDYRLNKNEKLALFKSTPKDLNCDNCLFKTSWFYFKMENGTWKMKNMIINKETKSSLSNNLVLPKLINIQNKFFIFKYDYNDKNQENNENYTTLELYTKGEFKEIFSDKIYSKDLILDKTARNDWESKITFLDVKNKIPNLLVEKIGIKDSKKFYEKKLYKFVNNKYSLSTN